MAGRKMAGKNGGKKNGGKKWQEEKWREEIEGRKMAHLIHILLIEEDLYLPPLSTLSHGFHHISNPREAEMESFMG